MNSLSRYSDHSEVVSDEKSNNLVEIDAQVLLLKPCYDTYSLLLPIHDNSDIILQ